MSVVANLANYVASKGPFGGVLGFSQGAVLAVTLIIDAQLSKLTLKPFRFGIFLCSGLSFDAKALKNNIVVQWSRKMEGAP
jgi:hypothetical protein